MLKTKSLGSVEQPFSIPIHKKEMEQSIGGIVSPGAAVAFPNTLDPMAGLVGLSPCPVPMGESMDTNILNCVSRP
jgi:hypothetical protein